MGRSSKQRKRGNKSGAKAGGSTAVPTGPYTLHLIAEPEFYEAADSAGCPCSLKDHDEDGLPGLVLVVTDLGKLADLLEWFAAGAVEDTNAKLEFPVTLSKVARANIHSLVSSKFSATLEAYSQGIGESRHISICKKGMAPSLILTPEQQDRVLILFTLAKEAGLTFSRDEIGACVQQGELPGPLSELWETRGKQLEASQQVCMAAALGDLPALQALLKAHPDVVQASVKEVRQGRLPLQVAAVAGQLDTLRVLHAAGADLEAVDADGQTALQAARRAEQCEAEATLLQLGAVDPEADVMPVTSHAHFGEEAAAAASGPKANGVSALEEALQGASGAAPADDTSGGGQEQPKAAQSADKPEADVTPLELVPPLEEKVVAPPAEVEVVAAVEEVVPAVAEEVVPAAEVVVPAVEEVAPAAEEVVPAVEEAVVPAVEEVAPAAELAPSAEVVAPTVEDVQDVPPPPRDGALADPSVATATLDDAAQHVQRHGTPVSSSCTTLRSPGEAAPTLDAPVVHTSVGEQPPSSTPAVSTGRSHANGEHLCATAVQQPREPAGEQHPQGLTKAWSSVAPGWPSAGMRPTNTWAAIGTGLALCGVAGVAYRTWRRQ